MPSMLGILHVVLQCPRNKSNISKDISIIRHINSNTSGWVLFFCHNTVFDKWSAVQLHRAADRGRWRSKQQMSHRPLFLLRRLPLQIFSISLSFASFPTSLNLDLPCNITISDAQSWCCCVWPVCPGALFLNETLNKFLSPGKLVFLDVMID